MDDNQAKPAQVTPGADMPVDPNNLTVNQPPPDPLANVVTAANPAGKQLEQAKQFSSKVDVYSHSQLEKKKQKLRSFLFFLLSLAVLAAIALPIYYYGPGLYKRITLNPDKSFETMLSNIMQVDTEFHSLEASSDFGLFSAKYDRSSADFFNPKSLGDVDLDLITGTTNIDASLEIVGVAPDVNNQNLKSLKIEKSNQLLGKETTGLVTNKWVSVPDGIDFSAEGLTVGFFEVSSGFNSPYRFLPIGNVPNQQDAAVKLQDLRPYSYDCRVVDDDNDNIVCDVRLSASKLEEFYKYLNSKNGVNRSIDTNWPSSFTVFIDSDTNLPTEIRINTEDSQLKQVMAFDVEIKKIIEPAGSMSLGDYRALAQQFEQNL